MSGEVYHGHTKEYLLVFAVLSILTVVELFIPGMAQLDHAFKGVLLSSLALVKAFFVAYFFMHLKEEKIWLKFIAFIPLSAVGFAFVLVLEGHFR
jgi:caa(3)-type oxidase subunit IV